MIRNRLPEIDVPKGEPFKNDKLNRESCANTFFSLIKLYSTTGCVIALNGEWGTGKTTFVKMLMQKMMDNNAHPLYFNAWENDYVSDPLVALLSELKDLSPQSSKWDNIISSGGKILTSIASSSLKNIIKNKIGIDSDAVAIGIDEVGKMLKDDIDDYAKQKITFSEFRKALQSYIADNTTEESPVVFFVDELDRCSPNFAVLVLERIKHLFDIPNVVFVLSVNKKQLGHAIQGYYGSANLDANNYLRRFIDIEYSLPQPDGESFCQYLYDVYDFNAIFKQKDREKVSELRSDGELFKRMANTLIASSTLDLRTIDKVFAHTRIALMGFSCNNYIIPDVFFLLCYLKIVNPYFYYDIIEEKLTAQGLVDKIEDYFPIELLVKNDYESSWMQMTNTIASFVYMYTLDNNGREREHIINPNDEKNNSLQTKHLDSETFGKALAWVYNRRHRGVVPLQFLVNRIELLQPIRLL